MNELISSNQPLTMSSREIAELTEKEHKTVMRDIRVMLNDLGHGTDLYLGQYSSNNRMYDEYNLPKRETLLLVSGYMLHVRVKIVDRLELLESQTQPQIPTNFAEALQLAANQAKALELAAPKVAFVDNFVEVGTTKTLRETAKILKYPERKMIALLVEDKVLYRQSGNLLPYQNRHEQGLFDVKTGERNGHAYTQTRVTTKGLEWLAGRYASELMEDN
ncbi:Rha family regulatory protein [Vibrio phage 1.162.O._10N.261.48.E3]|nr:Rha family regulatory protein [Vibrio phage 1.147.O._10N.286.49.E9]AUR91720.1 Rha family regulatory protein [Vibrio phage 1.162.O._10N.261.48.E3]